MNKSFTQEEKIRIWLDILRQKGIRKLGSIRFYDRQTPDQPILPKDGTLESI